MQTAIVFTSFASFGESYTFRVLYEFCTQPNCPGGASTGPFAPVIEDDSGNLYGTVGDTIFKHCYNGKQTVLYTFSTQEDGDGLYGGLTRDAAGNLYGTTEGGGDLTACDGVGCGTVFVLDPQGRKKTLYNFKGGTDGRNPYSGVIRDSEGNLYGTTSLGGNPEANCGDDDYGCGTVFKVDSTGKETVLHRFNGGSEYGIPMGGLVMDSQGNLYGTTYGNFSDFPGTLYEITSAGKEKVLHHFDASQDGWGPMGSLILDGDGNLYGTTSGGTPGNCGAVFKLTQSGKETLLYQFLGMPDGCEPQAGVAMDATGALYGTTLQGGTEAGPCEGTGCGTVFRVSPNGYENILYEFTDGSDGGYPRAGLFVDSKGNLYGTTPYGGSYNECGDGCGTLFKLTP
jgi:uncharacterized repeat protein (TIGR03803 family)